VGFASKTPLTALNSGQQRRRKNDLSMDISNRKVFKA